MPHRFRFALVFAAVTAFAADPQPSREQLQAWLRQYPAADANGDGELTGDEARAFLAAQREARRTPAAATASRPVPDRADVAYGPHERQRLDFWFAPDAARAAPLVVYLHGGGFVGGDKQSVSVTALRDARNGGAAFTSVNYRFLAHAPIQDILRDGARAVQYLRAHAADFRIDPQRIAVFGSSAGGGMALWLATHDDLAEPGAADPVRRQSSRLAAAAALNGQATYNLPAWEKTLFPARPEWLSSPAEVRRFYHFQTDADFATDAGRHILADCDMLGLLSADDPPLYLSATQPDGPPANRSHLLHHPRHAQVLAARARELGVPVVALYADSPAAGREGPVTFLLRHLQARTSP